MSRVRDGVAKGESLTEALHATGNYFPPLLLAMVEVSEASGKLAEGFLQLAAQYDHRLQLRRTFLTGITWPLIQLILAVCVVGFLIWIIGIIGSFTGQTVDVLGLGLVGTRGLLIYLAIVGSVAALIGLILWSARCGAAWTRPLVRLLLAVPVLGRALQTVALARCAWALSMTLDTSMDTRQAVRLALASTATERFARHADRAADDVEQGNELSAVLRRTNAFPDEFLDALEVGEQSGRAAEAMAHLARQYEEQARAALATLTVVAGVAVWMVIAALIVAVILRLMFFYVGMINDAASGNF